jgi:hypothetical protein
VGILLAVYISLVAVAFAHILLFYCSAVHPGHVHRDIFEQLIRTSRFRINEGVNVYGK